MEASHRVRIVRGRVPPALDGAVAGLVGLSERAPGAVRRRQPAGTLLPLVLSFGPPLHVEALAEGNGADRAYGSFVAGPSTGWADTRFAGGQDCVQVYLTPVGIRRILGVPGSEVARSVLPLGEIARDLDATLADRLHAVPTWEERLDLVAALLGRRADRNPAVPDWLSWMWGRIRLSGGRARIGDLVAATGWSHRYVATAFREETGLTPKEAAGVVRFERASADLGRIPLAEVAARHGYADQSHLAREVRRYAGETPGELAAARRPTPATALGPSVGVAQ